MITALARITKSPFVLFMTLGFLVSLAIFQLLDNWIQFWAIVYGRPNLGYHELPSLIHYTEWSLPWVVWLILAGIFFVDFQRRNFTGTKGYFAGIVLAVIASSIIAFIQFVAVFSRFD